MYVEISKFYQMIKFWYIVSLLNCRLLETSIGCSITIEHDNNKCKENIKCNIRFHGSHCLSSIFPIQMTRDGRMQMNFVFDDIGEVKKMIYNWDNILFL